MADQNYTEIVIIMDRSGSMEPIKKDMEGGLDRFFSEQKAEPGRCSVTLVQFDHEYQVVYQNKPLADVPPANLEPRGMTALLDAMGRTIKTVGERLAKTPECDRPGKVIVLVITDGDENASQEFKDRERIKAMVKEQSEKYSWLFVYLGANQDSFSAASGVGVATARDFKATPAGVKSMYSGASRGVARYRGGGSYNE